MKVWWRSPSNKPAGWRLKPGRIWIHKELGWTSVRKVTGKVALSKHSCSTCAHRCVTVCIDTHMRSLCYSSIPKGSVAGALIYLHNCSHSPEDQHLSAHVISQTPGLSLKKNKHSIFIPLFPVATCIHPSSDLRAVAKKGFMFAGYAGFNTAQPEIYCVKQHELLLTPLLSGQ